MAESSDTTTISDIVSRLINLGVDGATIAALIRWQGRDRWYAARDAILSGSENAELTALGFAAELDEHSHRIAGVNVAMVGLSEVMNGENAVQGVHQLTIDLAEHARRLQRVYGGLLNDMGVK